MSLKDAIRRQQRDPAEFVRQLQALRDELSRERQADRVEMATLRSLVERTDIVVAAIKRDTEELKIKIPVSGLSK